MVESTSLKIRAETEEDLSAFSVLLQDAILAPEDVTIMDGEAIVVLNRFCWELQPEPPEPPYFRTHTALRIAKTDQLQTRGLDLGARGSFHVLLSLALLDDGRSMQLNFSGDAELILKVKDGWAATLTDLGDPWPTDARPEH